MNTLRKYLAPAMLAALVCGSAEAATVLVSSSTDLTSVHVGDTFVIDLTLSSDFPGITGLNLDIGYDSAVLAYLDYSLNSAFNLSAGPNSVSPGAITGIDGSTWPFPITAPQPVVSAGATIATVTFEAIAAGAATVSFSEYLDGFDFALSDQEGTTASFQSASIQVLNDIAPVPIPASIMLLLSGGAFLASIGAARRRS